MRVPGSRFRGFKVQGSKVQGSEVQVSLIQRSQVQDSAQPLATETASLIDNETNEHQTSKE
jgi:hypothetical protein